LITGHLESSVRIFFLRWWPPNGCPGNALHSFSAELIIWLFCRMITDRERHFMYLAAEEARQGMRAGHGGPFGCIIVKGDAVIGRGHNMVLQNNDPTCHAEVVAIRDACAQLNNYQLSGCEIYCSCEPCPMCLGAIYWARPEKVYYANTRDDAAAIGFDDRFIYEELGLPYSERRIPIVCLPSDEAKAIFTEWQQKGDKTLY
jgi:guanine deaminase